MANVFTSTTLRDYLQAEFKIRHERNPAYSLRAFARDVGLSKSHLSDVLRGRTGLSRALLKTVGQKMDFSEAQFEHVWSLIEIEFGRSKLKRTAALDRLALSLKKLNVLKIELDKFRTIADWPHLAILEMIQLKTFRLNFDWIAAQLGLLPSLVEESIERLVALGVARLEEGHLVSADLVSVGNEKASEAIREFHKQVLGKAIEALETQSIEQRFFSTNFVAVRTCDLARARNEIQNFVEKFNEEFSTGANKDELYSLGLQFFDLRAQPVAP